MILREHLNRLVQIADERNMELCKLRYEANGAFNELQSRITQLNNQVENLKDEVSCMRSALLFVVAMMKTMI